jgi:hypothetical protein
MKKSGENGTKNDGWSIWINWCGLKSQQIILNCLAVEKAHTFLNTTYTT